MKCAVLIPTFQRPHRLWEVAENALQSSPNVVVYFVVEADDAGTMEMIPTNPFRNVNFIYNERSRNYAGAINTGVHRTTEPLVFAGADDLNFHGGWLEIATAQMVDPIKVVGTNDLANPDVLAGSHATHYLVARDYATNGVIDEPGLMLHEGYNHNWTDTEFIATARHRGAFTPCLASVVEHNHWCWGKASIDETYNKGSRTEPADRVRFLERQHLWT
jgi:hypothetical protein